MKTFGQSKKNYHGLSSAHGLATMEDLWRFARWVGDLLQQKITVDGVQFATVSQVEDKGDFTQAVAFAPPAPQYAFTRSGGAARVDDLADYARWLEQQMAKKASSADLGVQILAGKPGSLPLPTGALLFTRRELLTFCRAVGQRLGFRVSCVDASEARDTGSGLVVHRRKIQPMARLVIERGFKAVSGSICIERLSTATPGNFVIRTDTTQAYENGSVTSSVIASGVIQTWEEGETPDACAALQYPTDYDPEFDYGAIDGDPVIDETLVSYADFFSDVITAMLGLSETLQSSTNSWLPAEWESASNAMTGWNAVLVPTIGVVGSEGADNCAAGSLRWRAANTGTTSIQVYWSLLKTVDDSTVTSDSFTLAPGDVSDWIGPPTATPDLEESVYYKVTRISINGL